LLAILLWVASGLALLAGQLLLAAAIVVVIVLNAVFAFAQEHRADRSAERLRSLLPMSSRVRRDGQLRVIEASHLVRGDLVVLRPGDRISADLTLTVSHALRWMSRWLPAPSWYRVRERASSLRLAPIRPSLALLR
jgi:magnesium-transporting ATPase (P-type)